MGAWEVCISSWIYLNWNNLNINFHRTQYYTSYSQIESKNLQSSYSWHFSPSTLKNSKQCSKQQQQQQQAVQPQLAIEILSMVRFEPCPTHFGTMHFTTGLTRNNLISMSINNTHFRYNHSASINVDRR